MLRSELSTPADASRPLTPESPQRRVAMRSNAVGRLRARHAVIRLATLPSFGWVASMAKSYSVKRCTV